VPEDPRLLDARRRLVAACVTGTNGKTTTTSMIAAIVAAAGEPSARITTLGAWIDDEQIADGVSMDAFLAGLVRALAAGVPAPRARWTRQLDRAAAIAFALRHARSADVVLVAGKGHERTQIVGARTLPFSDVEEILRAAGHPASRP